MLQIVKKLRKFVTINSKVSSEVPNFPNKLEAYTRKTLKFIVWTLSKIAQSLIKADGKSKSTNIGNETEPQKIKRLLFRSKLISGGIQMRYISDCSQKTKDDLAN